MRSRARRHGVLLLPCQFALLNGDTNTADVDGMFFDGTRPTTMSATIPYATAGVVSNIIGYNDGLDVLGVDTPLGRGRPTSPFAGNCYTYSLIMVAKVMPASSGVTYGWNRTYRARDVAIHFTSTNTWYVTSIDFPTGPEPDSPNPPGTDKTVVPSTNYNVVVFHDSPAIYISPFTNSVPTIGDYVYEKRAFTYSLTNVIGTTNALPIQQVGTYIVAQRTNSSGVIANDWKGITNIASTTNIPDCSGVTSNEISAIVWPSTNRIILDQNVTNNY